MVIIFDNGYNDKLFHVKPVLEKFKIPATVFITVDMIGSSREYWCDEIEQILLEDKENIYKPIKIKIREKEYFWEIRTYNDAIIVYKELIDLLKYIRHEEREFILDKLFLEAHLERNRTGENHYPMTEKEIKQLVEGGFIEIGSRGMTDCILSCETEERQKWEIEKSKEILGRILGKEIKNFYYPFGTHRDYTKKTIDILKMAGYNSGITNNRGYITKNTNLYTIPGINIENWDINIFQNKLRKFKREFDIFNALKIIFFSPGLARKTYKEELLPRVKKFEIVKKNKSEIKNILQLNALDFIGGAAKITYNLHCYLLSKDYNAKMLVNNSTLNDEKVNVLLKELSEKQRSLYFYQTYFGWDDFCHLSSFNIKNYPSFQQADIVHIHTQYGYLSPFTLPELSSLKPTIWTLHDMGPFTGICINSFECEKWEIGCKKCPEIRRQSKNIIDATDFVWENKKRIYEYCKLTIVCPSNWLKEKAERSILKNQDIRMIYNGINEKIFYNYNKKEIRKKLGLPQDKLILLFVAYNGKENLFKGGHYLEEIYNTLKNSRNDLFFILIGSASSTTSSDNILHISYIQDEKTLASYFSSADLFIYPSLGETFGLVVAESMACGTPVVTFETGAIPEIVKHLETGYIAKYKDLRDFITGIKKFIDDKEIRNIASANSRQVIIEKFTLNKMLDNYLDLYKEIFNNQKYDG